MVLAAEITAVNGSDHIVTFLFCAFHVLRHKGGAVDGAVAAVGGTGDQVSLGGICNNGICPEGRAVLSFIIHGEQLDALFQEGFYLADEANIGFCFHTHNDALLS